jgi:hypothetical protein
MPILSNILNSSVAIQIGSAFNALTDAEKMAKLNAAYQWIADRMHDKGLTDFRASTHDGAVLTVFTPANWRGGNAVADAAGTRIDFDGGPIVGDYTLMVWSDTGLNVDAPLIEQDASGFTAHPLADGTTVYYTAIPNI